MNTTLIYLLQVNVGMILFYLFYRLFFAGDTFWKTRRLYLLLSFVASFAYPLLSIESWLSQPEPVQTALVHYTTLPEIVISPARQASAISIENILIGTYLLVVLALAVRMLAQLLAILRIRLAGKSTVLQNRRVIAVEREISPFSFFGSVFINQKLHTESETQQILAHELTHVRQWHSLDVFVAELLSIAFWINPAVWLLKREIRQNLEFLADHQVLRSGFNPKHYQYHLLQLSYQTPEVQLGNQFNVSPLKKRIMMMNKQNSNKAAILKYMLIVPLVLSLVLVANAQSVVKKTRKIVTTTSQKSTKVVANSKDNVTQMVESANSGSKPILVDSIEIVRQNLAKSNPDAVVTYDTVNKVYKSTVKFSAPVIKKDVDVNSSDGKVYEVVEKMPQYPGGVNELLSFLTSTIKYPDEAKKNGIQGRVIVRFVVDKTGKVTNTTILRGVSLELDNEALRVVNAMPVWTPGEHKGQTVAVYYALPIQFTLEGSAVSATMNGVVVKTSRKVTATIKHDGEAPLYIVDGKEITEADFNAIDSENIQSVNELKSESATKVYGEKGKNGVVEVKMKKQK